jgi:hypothetical protein
MRFLFVLILLFYDVVLEAYTIILERIIAGQLNVSEFWSSFTCIASVYCVLLFYRLDMYACERNTSARYAKVNKLDCVRAVSCFASVAFCQRGGVTCSYSLHYTVRIYHFIVRKTNTRCINRVKCCNCVDGN